MNKRVTIKAIDLCEGEFLKLIDSDIHKNADGERTEDGVLLRYLKSYIDRTMSHTIGLWKKALEEAGFEIHNRGINASLPRESGVMADVKVLAYLPGLRDLDPGTISHTKFTTGCISIEILVRDADSEDDLRLKAGLAATEWNQIQEILNRHLTPRV